jgi:hypothetical protein
MAGFLVYNVVGIIEATSWSSNTSDEALSKTNLMYVAR